MQNNNVIATEVAEKPKTSGKARFTAYMQGMKKLERKAQIFAFFQNILPHFLHFSKNIPHPSQIKTAIKKDCQIFLTVFFIQKSAILHNNPPT